MPSRQTNIIQNYATPQAVERAHYGDTQFVAARGSGVIPPVAVPIALFNPTSTTPIPAGIATDPNTFACLILNIDSSGSVGTTPTIQINGPPNHFPPVSNAGSGSSNYGINLYTWKPKTTDTSITITLNGITGVGGASGILVFIPSIGQHVNADSAALRSSNFAGGGSNDLSVTCTAPTFVTGDVTIHFGIELSGVPALSGTGVNQSWNGLVNHESACVGWNLTNATATETRGSNVGSPDSFTLWSLVYPGV